LGIHLTNRCFLSCSYCITNYNEQYINVKTFKELKPYEWIEALNRLDLPAGIPLTFQGGEPFIYNGIWEILENVRHKVDIITALPHQVTLERFKQLKTLAWNQRDTPYPTIRVSFHKGQNDYKQLITRIKELQQILSIGLFTVNHPDYPEVIKEVRTFAQEHGVEFRSKVLLREYEGKVSTDYKYSDACSGKPIREKVLCKNYVFPIGPDGTIYRCHSYLYARRREEINLMDLNLKLEHGYRECSYYGTCIPCDVKIKSNQLQPVDILFLDEKT